MGRTLTGLESIGGGLGRPGIGDHNIIGGGSGGDGDGGRGGVNGNGNGTLLAVVGDLEGDGSGKPEGRTS